MTYLMAFQVACLSIGLFCAVVAAMLWVKEYRAWSAGDWTVIEPPTQCTSHSHDYDDRGLCGYCEVERRLEDRGRGARSVGEIMGMRRTW